MGREQRKQQQKGFDKRLSAGWSCSRCAGPFVDLHWLGAAGAGAGSPLRGQPGLPVPAGGDFLASCFPAERKFPRCPALRRPSLSFLLKLFGLLFPRVTLISNN